MNEKKISRLSNPHDRAVLCVNVNSTGEFGVSGSSDHALRLWDLRNLCLKEELFGKRCGHYDWVTCCEFTNDNSVVSGGMDGKVCIWETNKICKPQKQRSHKDLSNSYFSKELKIGQQHKYVCKASTNRTKCLEIKAHSGSISCLKLNQKSNLGLSAGYDGKVNIWDTALAQSRVILETNSISPITAVEICSSGLLTGDRSGTLRLWDIHQKKIIFSLKNLHKHNIGQMKILDNLNFDNNHSLYHNVLVVAGQMDGSISLVDMRIPTRLITKSFIHKGSINGILDLSDCKFSTFSADGKTKMLDLKKMNSETGFSPISTFNFGCGLNCGNLFKPEEAVYGTQTGIMVSLPFNKGGFLSNYKCCLTQCPIDGPIYATKTFNNKTAQSNVSKAIFVGDHTGAVTLISEA